MRFHYGGCYVVPTMPRTFRPAGYKGKAERDKEHDARRSASKPWRNWYSSSAWQKARLAQLAREPLCERHNAEGRVIPATVVNHRKPHRGNWTLFMDPSNHESVCESCHNTIIQREERRAERE